MLLIETVVYDQDNQNLHLAESADCGSNLVAIGRGKDAVPNVTGDCSAPSFPETPAPTPIPAMTMIASWTPRSAAAGPPGRILPVT